MDERGLFLAGVLDASARALAAGAAHRQAGSPPTGAHGFTDQRAENETRIAHLAESVAVGTPQLFVAHLTWLRDAYAARGVPLDHLRANLECLRDELLESLDPDLHDAVLAQIDAGLAALRAGGKEIESALAGHGAHAELARAYLIAILEGRRDAAVELIEQAVASGASVSALELEVVAPVQAEVGRLWQRGDLRIAEEHLVSSIVEHTLATLRTHIPHAAESRRTALVASVPGNMHDIGARIVSDHLELAGWQTVFLGSDTPLDEILWSIGAFGAQLVALSATLPTQVRITARVVAAVRAAHPNVPVLVGGGVFGSVPDLHRAVDADAATGDALEAVELASRLVASPS